jgi:putative RNA 2'-phosphotransferase
MNKKSLHSVSKYISFVLRHEPENISLKIGKSKDYDIIDTEGYVFIADLLEACNITLDDLKEIVNSDNKGRYSFHSTKLKIRANQGHSTKKVNLTLQEKTPPSKLYHGTSSRFLDSIKNSGLKAMNRQYVHLSEDLKTAEIVGKRHGGELKILEIDTIKMLEDTLKFLISENDV